MSFWTAKVLTFHEKRESFSEKNCFFQIFSLLLHSQIGNAASNLSGEKQHTGPVA